MIEAWQKVWREGISPILSLNELKALKKGLEANDPYLIQRNTVLPFPGYVYEGDIESACAIAYCVWKGDRIKSPLKVDYYFKQICITVKYNGLKVNDFLIWYDLAPREEMIANLLSEVLLILEERL